MDDEHWERGYDSLNSTDSEYDGNRCESGAFNAGEDSESEYDVFKIAGNELDGVETAKHATAVDTDFAF